MSVMWLLGERFLDGGPRWTVNKLAERLMMPGHVLNDVITELEAQGLILTAEDDSVAPGRDLAMIKLASIMDAVRHAAPNPRCPQPRPVEAADLTSQTVDQAMRDALGERTLRDLLAADAPDGGTV
jgi:DNA-binding IscR family transcriptional regulator